MGKSPNVVSIGEVMTDPGGVAARWGAGATGLAVLIDADGQETGHKVGGPRLARCLARLASGLGIPEYQVAALALDLPRPLLGANQLKRLGYLVISWSSADAVNQAGIVILDEPWVRWLEEVDALIDAEVKEQFSKTKGVT